MGESYWKRIHQRAWREASHKLGFTSAGAVMIRVLGVVIVISVLAFWGSDDAPRDEIIFRAGMVGFVLASFPLVYCYEFIAGPPQNDADDKARIKELIEQLENDDQVRRLSLTQSQALSDAIRQVRINRDRIAVDYFRASPECADFASDIGVAIEAAGINVLFAAYLCHADNTTDRGVKITHGQDDDVRCLADAIHAELTKNGFASERRPVDTPNTFNIAVTRSSE